MSTIVRMRERHSHPDLTARKVREVETIARAPTRISGARLPTATGATSTWPSSCAVR